MVTKNGGSLRHTLKKMKYKNFLYSFNKNSTNQKQVELNVKFEKHFNKNNFFTDLGFTTLVK